MSQEPETVDISFGSDEEAVGQAANLVRGTIITSFSHVEFMCTDLIARCMSISDYVEVLNGKLPFPLEKKIKAAKKLFSVSGHLESYKEYAVPLIDKLLSFEHTRHFMAHGMMVYFGDAGEKDKPRITFRIYRHTTGGLITLEVMESTLDQLAAESREIGIYALDVANLFVKIISETGLQPPAVKDGVWSSHPSGDI